MKTKPGNSEALGQVIFFTYPLVALIVGSLVIWLSEGGAIWNVTYGGALLLVILGGVNIVRGKWPKYRAGHFFSFGAEGLPSVSRRYYRTGWRLVGAGSVLAVGLLALLGVGL